MEKRRRAINIDIVNKLAAAGCKVFENRKLSEVCSFKIGGNVNYFIEIPHEPALSFFLKTASVENFRFFILGGGTNVLFSDKGFSGCVIKLMGDFKNISIDGVKITCGGAVFLPSLVKKSICENLSGLECCAGIPGTVGGAVLGNAGSGQNWISDTIESVEVYNRNGEKELINKEKIDFDYRKSGLENFIISKVNFTLKKETGNGILKVVSDKIKNRAKTQPLPFPSAGCIFRNPLGLSAGKLIEDAGLKGRKKRGAKVSEIHANFIINVANATADDVLDLIYTVRKTVKDKFNIDLELEIKVIKA
ncbi:MAG: UDP-N-acetylmuramate dehydrogenase [Endomicrobium sp.]|jgi:UDP-N-acetylmuramate dehydrogenase|nr:UDP-N-acetylmuramate dehydrogenase [Endomicrobium sp.]